MKTIVTVETKVGASPEKVWEIWNNPRHIVNWNFASDDWQCPSAENDLRVDGKLSARMEAKDASFGFSFEAVYNEVKPNERIAYTMDDGRKVSIDFKSNGNSTTVTEAFEAEETNPVEMQRQGWQAILNNFKKYAEEVAEQIITKETLHYEITIGARSAKVYDIMLNEKLYSEWTSVFNPSSRFEGTWEAGSKILFLGADDKGSIGGMISHIRENIPGRFVSIEHVGMIESGIEITSGPKVEPWKGTLENYTFTGLNESTLVSIDLIYEKGNIPEQIADYFNEFWPKALEKLKEICER